MDNFAKKYGLRRTVNRAPDCPGDAVPHMCDHGTITTYEPAPEKRPAPADKLPVAWYRGASARAVAFWLALVVLLSLPVAYAFARDAIAHGFDLAALHAWCAAHGFTL